MRFAFFHVGSDITQPKRLVESIYESNPNAEIHMASDEVTPPIPGVGHRVNIRGDRKEIMSMRLAGFTALVLNQPTFYLDTDMIVLEKLNPSDLLGDKQILFLRRTFNREVLFNPHFRDMDLTEYTNRSMDEVYPYIAACTVTRDWKPWGEMFAMLDHMNPKFKEWYGDQEALKLYSLSVPNKQMALLHERDYACLPEHRDQYTPKILHYKGAARKQLFEVS